MPREFPISSLQKHTLLPNPKPNAQLSLSFGEPINRDCWKKAWALLQEQHPLLRSTLCSHGDNSLSLFEHDNLESPWTEVDWASLELSEIAKQWPSFQAKELHTLLATNDHPLWRIAFLLLPQNQSHLLLTFHPALFDEQSLLQLLRQWFAYYEMIGSGAKPEIHPTASYAAAIGSIDFLEEEASTIWKNHLGTWNRSNPFACFTPATTISDSIWHKARLDLDVSVSQKLIQLAQQLDTNIGTLLASAWGMVLCRFGGDGHALVGLSASARSYLNDAFQSVLGPYQNTLPLHIQEPFATVTLKDWLISIISDSKKLDAGIFSSLMDCANAVNIPLESLPLLTDVRWTPRSLNHNLHSEMPRWLGIDAQYFESFTTPVAIRCVGEQRLEIDIHIDPNHFAPTYFENLIPALNRALVALVENETITISNLFPSEKLEQSSGFQLTVEPDLLTRILTSLSINASAEAIRHGKNNLTFSEIDAYSNQFARFLRKARNVHDAPIAICLNHTPWVAVVLLALLKDHTSAFFLNPSTITKDTNDTLEKLNCTLLITDSTNGELFSEIPTKKILIDEAWEKIAQQSDSPLQTKQGINNSFFAFLEAAFAATNSSLDSHSGSHIPPSILQIPLNWYDASLTAALQLYNLEVDSRLLSTATPGTPEYLQEIIVCLVSGATLIQATNDISATRSAFQEAIREDAITHLQVSTPWWTQWIQFLSELKQSVPESLTHLVLAAGQINPTAINAWEKVSGRPLNVVTYCSPIHLTGVGFVNLAGLTTITPCAFSALPIGTNIETSKAFVVDSFNRELPDNCQGEIILRLANHSDTHVTTDHRKIESGSLEQQTKSSTKFHSPSLLKTGWKGYRANNVFYILDFPDRYPKAHCSFVEQQQIRKELLKHPATFDVIVDRLEPSSEIALWLILREADNAIPNDLGLFIKKHLPTALCPKYAIPLPRIPLDPFERINTNKLPRPEPIPEPQEIKSIQSSPTSSFLGATPSLDQSARRTCLQVIRPSESHSPLVLIFENPQTELINALQTKIPPPLALASLKLPEEHWREDSQPNVKEACAYIRGTMRHSPTYIVSGGSLTPFAINICHRLRKDKSTQLKLVLVNPEIPISLKTTAFQLWNQFKELLANFRSQERSTNIRLSHPTPTNALSYHGPLSIITETKPNPLWKKHFPNAQIQQLKNLDETSLAQLLKKLVED